MISEVLKANLIQLAATVFLVALWRLWVAWRRKRGASSGIPAAFADVYCRHCPICRACVAPAKGPCMVGRYCDECSGRVHGNGR